MSQSSNTTIRAFKRNSICEGRGCNRAKWVETPSSTGLYKFNCGVPPAAKLHMSTGAKRTLAQPARLVTGASQLLSKRHINWAFTETQCVGICGAVAYSVKHSRDSSSSSSSPQTSHILRPDLWSAKRRRTSSASSVGKKTSSAQFAAQVIRSRYINNHPPSSL